MDIRIVESLPTSGGLIDPMFRVNPSLENVSLTWDEDTQSLNLVDYNLDYSVLPYQIGTDMVKKTFLTYNGKNCSSGQMVETVLIESSSETDLNQIPGYNNSNEWTYTPSTFTYDPALQYLTDPADYANMPFDYSQGFTVVKQFLTAQANLTPGTPAYTAFYRAPHLTSFLPANVENNRIYTDGWYTSYIIACKTWDTLNPAAKRLAKGTILFHQDKFYINITGAGGALVTDPNDPLLTIPDTTNWASDPNFEQWVEFLRGYTDATLPGAPVYYVESQHLVTVELNKAILSELKKQCSCCNHPSFGSSSIMPYMKLMQKRLGAYVQFNSEIFHEAQCILESSRGLCQMCIYDNDCNCK